MDNPFQSPALLSICPGSGGLEKGIEHATGAAVRIAAYVEIEAFIIENLVRQMEQGVLDPAPVWSDVKTFLPFAHYFRGKVHGITAGYPCQPFSKAGERKGSDDPRHLWPYVFGIVDAVRPVWCFFENVRGHLKLGYDQVYKDLRSIGYSVECGIYSAEEVGATHERERLFILAVADSYRMAVRGGSGYLRSSQETTESEMGKQDRQRSGGNTEHSSAEVGDSIIQGSEERISDKGRQRKKRSADRTEHPGDRRIEEVEHPDSGNEFDVSGQGVSGKEHGRTGDTGGEMENPALQHTQGYRTEGKQEPADTVEESLLVSPGGEYRWPAPPGREQHPWEAPRLVAGMDCAVNGYNFREDLLRMVGNAVVHQTAAKAYIDLLSKFR